MRISIPKLEAKTQCGCKVVINTIELENREVISGYYVDSNGKKKNMSWNAVGINNSSVESLWIPKKYLENELYGAIKLAKKLNKLMGYE